MHLSLLRTLYDIKQDAQSSVEDVRQLHREILMSYRLLFGQRRASRKLAKAELYVLKRQDANYDQLLNALCTQSCDSIIRALPLAFWPVTCRSFEGYLQEESAYSSQDDFPLFGQRLAKLQEFTLRQQPSRLRDLWRDRRNPLQWYTFWAVLIFGCMSIIIALLQLAVAVAQLAAASPSNPNSCCNADKA